MADILHRLSIDAPQARVHELVATKQGVEQWWTARPLEGDDALGGELSIYFPGRNTRRALMEIVERTPERVVWRCLDGPADWRETRISFELRPRTGGTTLLFRHAGWQETNEFMGGCSTNWGAYLSSLKAGAEGRGFAPYPAGEVSRWD